MNKRGKLIFERGMIIITILFALGFIGMFSGHVNADTPSQWTIEGNTVFIDDINSRLTATPHTISQSQWVEFNVTSKVYTGNVDVILGFTNGTKITIVQLKKEEWHNTTNSYTCEGDFFNYTLTPKHGYCYYNITTSTFNNQTQQNTTSTQLTLVYDREFEWGNIPAKTIYWNTSYKTDWKEYSGVNTIDYSYGGMDKWYYSTGIPIVKDNTYTFRAYVDVPFNKGRNSGKYWFGIKRSSDTIQEAIANDRFYMLDPWWNSSWTKKKPITIAGASSTLTNFTAFVRVPNNESIQSDYGDVRFTLSDDTTELNYELEYYNTTNAGFWIRIPSLAGDTIIHMYYNATTTKTTTSNKILAWDSLYSIVYHLNSSSTNSMGINNGTDTAMTYNYASGIFGGGALLDDGSGSFIRVNNPIGLPSGNATFSIMFFAKPIGAVTGNPGMVTFGAEATKQMAGFGPDANTIYWLGYSNDIDTTVTYDAGGWSQFGSVSVGENTSFFKNGTLLYNSKLASTINIGTVFFNVGEQRPGASQADNHFDGLMDEIRIYNGILSADYMRRFYDDMNMNTTTFGAEESSASDTTAPTISITIPATNNTNFSYMTNVNYTATDETALGSCWWTKDLGATNTTLANCGTNITGQTWNQGLTTVIVYVNDTSSNNNSATIAFNTDTIYPNPTITVPSANNSVFNYMTNVNYTSIDTNLESCWWSKDLGATNTSLANCGTNVTGQTWSQGNTTVIIFVNDTVNNVNSTSITFLTDTISPVVTSIFPASDGLKYTTMISPTFTEVETNPSVCWWTKDSGVTNTSITCGNNVTGQTWSQGSNIVTYSMNDSANNIGSATRQFDIDTIVPVTSIIYPANTTYNTQITSLNYTYTDTNADSCWYSVDNGVTNSSRQNPGTNFTGITSVEGSRTFNLYCNDTYGNVNLTSAVTFFQDTVFPLVSTVYPTAINYSINVSAFNYTVYDLNTQACWYSQNNGATNTSVVCGTNLTGLTSNEGWNNWTIYANDTAGNQNSSMVSFFKDTIFPQISITNPATNNTNFSYMVGVNYTVSDTNLQSCWWTNSSGVTNTSLTCGTNITGTWNQGANTVIVYANDTVNNVNSSTMTFNIDTIFPTIDFVTPTETNNTYVSRSWLLVNVTSVDTNLANITVSVYNSSRGLVKNITTTTSPNYYNFSSLADGIYYFNATAYDFFLNKNDTATRQVTLDTTMPLIQFGTGTDVTGVNRSRTWIYANVTTSDTNFANITFNLYNSTYSVINTTTYTTLVNGGRTLNWTGLTDGVYYYNVTTRDLANNQNSTETRKHTLDTTAPALSVTSPTEGTTYNIDSVITTITADSGLSSIDSYTQDGVVFSGVGTKYSPFGGIYSVTLCANDTAGNSACQSINYLTQQSTGSVSYTPGGGGGSSSVTIIDTDKPSNLSSIKLKISDWKYNIENHIEIRLLDTRENLTDVDSLNVMEVNGKSVDRKLIRKSVGLYDFIYVIKSQDVTSPSFKITAIDGAKTLTETTNPRFVEQTMFSGITDNADLSVEGLKSLFQNRWLEIMIFFGGMFGIYAMYAISVSLRRR